MRVAAFGDIPRLVEMLGEAQAASIHSGLTFDAQEARRLVFNAIQRHGRRTEGASFVAVVDGAERIEAFVIGVLQRVYLIQTELEATDLFLIATEAAPREAASALLGGMKAWAWASPAVVQVVCAATGVLGRPIRGGRETASARNWKITGRWLRASGMTPCGEIYREGKPL